MILLTVSLLQLGHNWKVGVSLSSTDRLFSNSEDIDIAVDLETGEVVEPPDEVFPIQILNNIKLVVE